MPPKTERRYDFRYEISREVLENYLSRAITVTGMLHDTEHIDENVRMITNVGAKFLGRAILRWGGEAALPDLLEKAAPLARRFHEADPDIVLQGCVFEIVSEQVSELEIPPWVFRAFDLEPERRRFRYEEMLYPEEENRNQWASGASVPDMSRLETRLWFFYAAASYIDIGIEGIHFGQVEIMDNRDPSHEHWRDMMTRVRRYAAEKARRNFLLCDAHVPGGGLVYDDGELMFDFHSFPLRIREVDDEPYKGVLEMGYLDSIYGRSAGGRTPSGWSCESLPYIVEIDNFGSSGHEGENIGDYWCWGWDEISWFANQPEGYRNEWLRYAWDWVREHDPNGYFQMPGMRGRYKAHMPSPAMPDGFGQEETIKAVWKEDA